MNEGARVELDFDVIREPWNKYELNDGTILKTRYILHKLVKTKKPDETGFSLQFRHRFESVAYNVPQNLRLPPSTQTYTPQELQASIVESEIRYNVILEEWNEYVVEDGTRIRIKTTVVHVARTNKADKNGDPIYLVNSSQLADVRLPKK